MLRHPMLPALALLAILATSAAAKPSTADRYLHPRFADFQVRSIAILPVAVRHPADGAAETVSRELERSLGSMGYRWISTSMLRTSLGTAERSAELDRLGERLRRVGSLDTTEVRSFGALASTDALLATLVTTWERETIDFNMSGQSMTQIAMTALLYSAKTGELLWSRRFQVKGEGPYNTAGDGSNILGVSSSGLQTAAPRTSTSLDPPSYEEVAAKLAGQLHDALPPLPKPAAP
jgi:hypothetical protein